MQELVVANQHATDETLALITKTGSYLARIQLLGSNSKIVKQGKFPIGHFGLFEGKVPLDLTTQFVAFNFGWRAKAMQFEPEVISAYDPKSALFKQFKTKGEEKNSGHAFGPEILLWLPDYKKFACFFLGNPTGRNEAPNLIGLTGKACCIKSELIETKKYSWHGPKTYAYDIELSNKPDVEEAKAVIEKFNNPPQSELEPAEEDSRER